jgi:hypothetical protein
VHGGPAEQDPSSEDELMGLLGVEAPSGPSTFAAVSSSAPHTETPANTRGVLQVSKEEIVASARGRGDTQQVDGADKGRKSNESNPRQTPKKKGNKRETVVEKGFSPAGESQDGVPLTKAKPRAPASAKHANSRARHVREDNGALSDPGLQPFNLAALSQSLPSQNGGLLGLKSKNVKANGKDKHEVWDAAVVSGSDNLTVSHVSILKPSWSQADLVKWQQKLHSSTFGSGKSHTRAQGEKKKNRAGPSSFNQNNNVQSSGSGRPGHTRRASTDSVPSQHPPRSAPPYPHSGYDDDIPYHVGLNIGRAPQTPSKDAVRPMTANSPLPIIPGEFPRLGRVQNKAFDNVLGPRPSSGPLLGSINSGGLKYAGPTAHSSPHAASLAKPDLDDF